jgi:4-hydroxyphenylacetate 3-monooxygenase
MLPSSVQDFDNPVMAEIIEKTQVSEGISGRERVKFLKLAWDVLGSEFAGRHQQYEMFYAGAQFVTRGHSYRNYDWDGAKGLVDDLMSRH